MFDTRGKNDTRTHLWLQTMMFPVGERRIALLDVAEGCFHHWHSERRFDAKRHDEVLLVNDDAEECRRMRLEVAASNASNVRVVCGDIHSVLPVVPTYAVVWLDYCHSPANIFAHQVARAARAVIPNGSLAITASQRVNDAQRRLVKLLAPHVQRVDGFYSYGDMGPIGFLEGRVRKSPLPPTGPTSPEEVIVIDDSDDETDRTPMLVRPEHAIVVDDSAADDSDSDDERYVPRATKRLCITAQSTGWVCLPCARMHPISTLRCTSHNCSGTREADGVPFDRWSKRQTRSESTA